MSTDAGGRDVVAVVGAGAAGLAASFRLQQAGHEVHLFDKKPVVGGRMKTVMRDGFMLEDGPTVMARSYRSILGIAEEAGLADEVVPASGVFGFPGPDDRLHLIDTGRMVRDIARTDLVSARAKLRAVRLGAEILRRRRKADIEDLSRLSELDGESAETYCRRLMGDEMFDYLGDPCVRTLVGCASAEVSAVDVVFAFANFMMGQEFVAFRNGMQSFAEQLGSRFELVLSAEVHNVEERPDEVRLSWTDGSGAEHNRAFAGVVLACDANVSSKIHGGLDEWRREFLREGVRYSCMTPCTVAVDKAPELTCCYIFPPVKRHPRMPVIALEHNKVGGRAPEGKGIISLYPPSDLALELWDESDDVIAKSLMEAAEPVVPGLTEHALWTHVARIRPTVMQTWPGYWTRMREFHQRSAGKDKRVRLAGDYFCISNVNTASASGERAARELVAHLG